MRVRIVDEFKIDIEEPEFIQPSLDLVKRGSRLTLPDVITCKYSIDFNAF